MKCKTDVLYLIKEQPSSEQIRSRILAADIIYVGGGNTLQMMRIWRRLSVDKFLKAACENGTVLSGISAGSICWFRFGAFRFDVLLQPSQMEVHQRSRSGAYPRDPLPPLRWKNSRSASEKAIDGRFYRVIRSKRHARAYQVK